MRRNCLAFFAALGCLLMLVFGRTVFAQTRVRSLIPGAAAADALVSGESFSCAITTDGHVMCWGKNDHGQLGRDTKDAFSAQPQLVVGLDQVISLAAGQSHACAVRQNGSLWCWGDNLVGQIGDDTTTDRYLPVPVAFPYVSGSPKTGVIHVAAGVDQTCAVDDSNSLYCWGGNGYGESGLGAGIWSHTPARVNLNNVVSVHAGAQAYNTCAVIADGSLACWGYNGEGECGTGSNEGNEWVPAPVIFPPRPVPFSTATRIPGVTSISINYWSACASTDAGEVFCWGDNWDGRVTGDGTTQNQVRSPVLVSNTANGVENITQVSVTQNEACALRGNGTLRCWGGGYGPTVITRSEIDVVTIASGALHECLFRRDSSGTINGVYCSGDNAYGELGIPASCDASSCAQMTYIGPRSTATVYRVQGNLPFTHIGSSAVSAGTTTCVRMADGMLKCWGLNNYGQVGNNTTTDQLVPTNVATASLGATNPPADIVQVASGIYHNCALKWDGTVWCWGSSQGLSSPIPVQVAGLSGVVQIAAGNNYSCALLSNGSATCWGANSSGTLGNGTTTASDIPVTVGLNGQGLFYNTSPQQYFPLELVSLHAANFQICGTYKGLPVCWGAALGTTGYFPTAYQNLPATYATLVVGTSHACGLLSNGGVNCWGSDIFYQRGDGNTSTSVPPTTPTTIASLTDVVELQGGSLNNCAWTASNSIPWCWGYNARGGLGDGTTVSRSVPAPASAAAPYRAAGGYLSTCVLGPIGQVTCWGDNNRYRGIDGVNSTTMITVPTNAWGFACAANSTEYQPSQFSDSQACTDDVCQLSLSNGTNGVSHPNMQSGSWCSDKVCKGGNRCDGSGSCSLGASNCSDNDLCTTDSCNANTDSCENNRYPVDDGNDCTYDLCFRFSGPAHPPVEAGTPCSSGSVCSINKTCDAYGNCSGGTSIPLPQPPDNTGCTSMQCDPFGGPFSQYAPLGALCNDGDLCTVGDACDASGHCSGTPQIPETGNACTKYVCDKLSGALQVVPWPQGTPCAGSNTGCDGSGHCRAAEASLAPPLAAPPLDVPGGEGTVAARTSFLYAEGGVQTRQLKPDGSGSIEIHIDANRQSVIRGRVLGQDGLPLPNVKITIKDNPQYGQTYSRADGWYDLAVEGGGGLIVSYTKTNYLPVQRHIQMAWNEYVPMNDVILDIPQQQPQLISLTSNAPVVHQGLINTSPSGTQRRGTILIFPRGVVATGKSNLATYDLQSMNIASHEYTRDINPVGTSLEGSNSLPVSAAPGMSIPTGMLAMPGELPSTTSYTYAVELFDSNQLSDDTMSIAFSGNKPALYVDNFLGMNIGSIVPLGSYGRDTSSWTAEPDGIVVKIVSKDDANHTVGLDIDSGYGGDPTAEDNATEVAPRFGISIDALSDELTALYDLTTGSSPRLSAGLGSQGSELWRVGIPHFSTHDLNFYYAMKNCAAGGPCPDDNPGSVSGIARGDSKIKDCETVGSRILCESHVLGEKIPVAGTDFSLVYSSDRVPGYSVNRKLHVEFPGQPRTKDRTIGVDAFVAGQQFAAFRVAGTGTSADIAVAAPIDPYGRILSGSLDALVVVTEWYNTYVMQSRSIDTSYSTYGSFGRAGSGTVSLPDRSVYTRQRFFNQSISYIDSRLFGLGGWDLSIHHWYDAKTEILYRGDGLRVKVDQFSDNGYMVDKPIRGSQMQTNGCAVKDGTGASQLGVVADSDIAIAPNGDIFVSNPTPGCVYSLSMRNCTQTSDERCTLLVAGGGSSPSTATGPIADRTKATSVKFNNRIRAISAGPDGSLYIGEAATLNGTFGTYVHRVFPDATDSLDKSRITSMSQLQTIAGTGAATFSGDGGAATDASLGSGNEFDIDVSKDGTVYILSSDPSCSGGDISNSNYAVRLRSVDPNGVIRPLVGGGSTAFTWAGLPAVGPTLSCLYAPGPHIAVTPKGEVYAAGSYDGFVLHRDGRLEHIWSNDAYHGSQRPLDGVLATTLGALRSLSGQLANVTSASDGSVFIVDLSIRGLRRVDSSGIITTLINGEKNLNSVAASNPDYLISIDANHPAVPALRVGDFWSASTLPNAAAVAPNGDIYLLAPYGGFVLRAFRTALSTPGCANSVPSTDGSEIYCFNTDGNHWKTFDGHLVANGARIPKYTFDYDPTDKTKLTGVTDANGNRTSIARTSGDVKISPPIGDTLNPTTIHIDSRTGYAQSVDAADGGHWDVSMSMASSSLGLLQSLRDPSGALHQFTYNDVGELLTDGIAPSGSSTVTSFQTLDFSTTAPGSSNSTTRSTKHTSAEGLVTNYVSTRDSSGLETRKVTDQQTGELYQTVTQTDGSTSTTMPDGTVLQSVPNEVDPLFPGAVQLPLRTVTLPNGISVRATTRRDSGVLAQEGIDTYTFSTGPVGATHDTILTYTPSSNSLETQTPAGRHFTTTFDGAGHVHSLNEPGLAASTFDYSSQGGVNGLLSQIQYRGNYTNLTYGTAGNPSGYLSSIQTPFATTNYTWAVPSGTSGSQVTEVTNAESTSLTWDAMQNLSRVQTPNGGAVHTQSFDYFNLQNSYTAPAGSSPPVASSQTTFTRNLDRQAKSIRQPGRDPISLAYTGGRLSYLFMGEQPIQVGNQAIDWEYVPVPASGTTNGGGHVSTITGPGAATNATPPLTFANSVPKLTYTYAGYLPMSESWLGPVVGSVATTYDTSYLMPVTKNVSFTSGTNTFTSNITRTFDADGALTCTTSTSNCGQNPSDFVLGYGTQYGSSCVNGRLCQAGVGNAVETYSYDGYGALQSQTQTVSGSAKLAIAYPVRDALGRIYQKQETRQDGVHAFTYLYDALGRLSDVSEFFNGNTTTAEHYTYDSDGNRLTEINSPSDASYDAQDRLKEFTTGDGDVWQFTYADNGALQSRVDTTTNSGTNLIYDELGNLTHADVVGQSGGPQSIDYVVDGRGRRIGKKVSGAFTRQWIYDGQLRIIAELATVNGTTTMNRFIYGSRTSTPEVMFSYASPNSLPTVYRILSDHLGSPRLVVNASTGAVVLDVRYDSFGAPKPPSQGTLDFIPFGFAGGLYDVDTGLVRFGVRDFDPRFGRWVSKDPILFRGNQSNLYVYAHNDPVNFVDRDGHFVMAVGAAIAAGVALGAYIDYLYIPSQDAMNLPGQWLGAGDAYRHCLASCIASSQLGPDIANWLGDLRESFEKDAVCGEGDMDRLNNRTGSDLGQDVGFGDADACRTQCSNALWFGDLARME